MVDWLSSMQQSYEYYIVDPGTWKDVKLLSNVTSCSISRDSDVETLGSATIDVTETIGECYVRAYLITIQNGVREKHSLGTFLVQTPSSSFQGSIRTVSMDAYTPLLELKENPLPLGYFTPEGSNIMEQAYLITRDRVRAPVVRPKCDKNLFYDFVSDVDENGLSYVSSLIRNANHQFDIDEMGRILFSPKQDTASLQPVWDYDDGNSSILYQEITMNHDLFGIPNVVEVIYSNNKDTYYAKVINDDPNSPTSTVNRGRQIIDRVSNPDLIGDPTNNQIQEYARQRLKELSTIEYTVSYTHGYCPVRLGDCVRLNYKAAGITDIKAKVISQNIKCEPGCPVSEKAVFTTKLWG